MAERTRGYAHRVDVAAPVELVWRGLVDPTLLASWCGPGARVSAREGGSYNVRLNGELEREAHIDVFDPGRRLRLIYLPPRGLPETEAVMVDDFILGVEQDSVAVRLMGSGFPQDESWDHHYARVRGAWGLALAKLKVCSEQLASGKRTLGEPPAAPAPRRR
jgi:uncharacterized protein YndB with AHSA1/START domain